MEITRIASERNDEGDYRLDCCVGYVKLFLLDRWRCRAVDGTLRRKGLHWLLGPLCLYKQSSKGRKIFLNSLGVVSEHCVITFFTIYRTFINGSIVVCMLYLLFLYEGCYMKTLCTIKPLLNEFEGTSLLAFQGKYCSQLLPFSPTSLFRYSTCT